MNAGIDRSFAGLIPELYERFLVPLIFEPYAVDLAARVALARPSRVLEIAAGTGVVTRRLANVLSPAVVIVATDVNQSMLDQAVAAGAARTIEFRQADAMNLPFAAESFDVVVCQFGVMFFPDKVRAFSEARRVLRPGGVFIFNVWDRICENEFADVVNESLSKLFLNDPPRFLARVPHGYHSPSAIAGNLAQGGFARPPAFTTLASRSRATDPSGPAIAYCRGTPLRNEIEARDASRLVEATDVATTALAKRFGSTTIEGKIQAHVVEIER